MILCQKPSSVPLNPSFHHRRHPSAPPAVVVHPTCIPGLLSLSKPPRPSPQRPQQHTQQLHQQRQSRTPKFKLAAQPPRSPSTVTSPSAVKVPAPKPSVDTVEKKTTLTQTATPAPSPDKHLRGRQHAKPAKDKTTRRSASHSSVSGQTRRNNNRQPSPPVQLSSQAEGPNFTHPAHSYSKSFSLRSSNHTSNHFDPFVVNSSSDTDSGSDSIRPKGILTLNTLQSAPKLAPRPSGKLAARRQPIPDHSSPSPPSRAVPVPRSILRTHDNISRSDPVLSHMVSRQIDNKHSTSDIEWDSFPVCDDMTIDNTPPSTPVHRRRTSSAKEALWQTSLTFDDGPRTAPLSSKSAFPFDGYHSPTPSSPTRTRRHQRTPSEGVFHMSFDEDTGLLNSDELKALIGMFPKRRSPSSNVRLSKDKAGYFASSMFQNSPSPDELPPPSFGALA